MIKALLLRPVLVIVLGVVIVFFSLIAVNKIPVSLFPLISPPTIEVTAVSVGADAQMAEDTVTQVLEQNMTNLDNLMFMNSSTDTSGHITITLTFSPQAEMDIAQVQVQKSVQQATPRLPAETVHQGIKIANTSGSWMMIVGFASKDPAISQVDISDYINNNVINRVRMIDGVGSVSLFGTEHAWRIWLDPIKLQSHALTIDDVKRTITNQTTLIATGQLGGLPSTPKAAMNYPLVFSDNTTTGDDLNNVVLSGNQQGAMVHLRDVARVEYGSESYNVGVHLNGQPASGIGIKLKPGANALEVGYHIFSFISSLKRSMPQGIVISYPWNTVPYVKTSLQALGGTLCEAVIITLLILFIFFRTNPLIIIPALVIPVVLLATVSLLYLLGYSLNLLTLFGLILAIGIIVDDSIVIIDKVDTRTITEHLPLNIIIVRATSEIAPLLLAITLVLTTIFLPMLFIHNSAGVIYQQFAASMIIAIVISLIVSLLFVPVLLNIFPWRQTHAPLQQKFLAWFNLRITTIVTRMLQQRWLFCTLLLVMFMLVATGWFFLPTSFVPDEDQGSMMVMVKLPPGSSEENTEKVMHRVSHYYLTQERSRVNDVFTVSGMGFNSLGQNLGFIFISLKSWDERSGSQDAVQAVIQRSRRYFSTIPDAFILAFNNPAIPGLGNSNGFAFELVDKGNLGHQALLKARNQLLWMMYQEPDLFSAVRPAGEEDEPVEQLSIRNQLALSSGVKIEDITSTIQTAMSGSWIAQITYQQRNKKIIVMGDAPWRMLPQDIGQWYVRNKINQMVPVSSLIDLHWGKAAKLLERYNGFPAIQLLGEASEGHTTGEVMQRINQLAHTLPDGITLQWTSQSLQEQQASQHILTLMLLSLLVIWLVLAALYESWKIPLIVLLCAPLGVSGVVLAAWMSGANNDIYFHLAVMVTVGLTIRNAVMIIDVMNVLSDRVNLTTIDTIHQVLEQRVRPVLMTSIAFISGIIPLAISNSVGKHAQNNLGMFLIGGLFSSSSFIFYYAPFLYFIIIGKKRSL
ncbi:efflux RND transporter permease subunit [Pantoea dispersa]|uniref:efflux RND transporter permease subunit n=1 Tax=Pantoea dispersa TaxID=59814 RepID=UPI001BAB3CE5|nr:efflux RND transporter permease subunit [Pantoea dispersa]MBS0899809.1 efflux RND transporter permease subunit [Pantoea dispersa]MBS0907641.1 efflux RND transporter permease subunit [Pantoea dispersa]